METKVVAEQIKEEVTKLLREELALIIGSFRNDLLDVWGDMMREVKSDLQVEMRDSLKRKRENNNDNNIIDDDSNKRPRFDDSPVRNKEERDNRSLESLERERKDEFDREEREREREEDRRVVTDKYISATGTAVDAKDTRSLVKNTRDDNININMDSRNNNYNSYDLDREQDNRDVDLTPRSNYNDNRNIDNIRYTDNRNMREDNQPQLQHNRYYDDNNNNNSNSNNNNNNNRPYNNNRPDNRMDRMDNRHQDNRMDRMDNPRGNNMNDRGGGRGGGPNFYGGDKRGMQITTTNTRRIDFKGREGGGRGGGGPGGGQGVGGQGGGQGVGGQGSGQGGGGGGIVNTAAGLPPGVVPGTGDIYYGTIRELKPHRYGKIGCPDLSQDWIWFSYSQIRYDHKQIKTGDSVEFELGHNGTAQCANNIRLRGNLGPMPVSNSGQIRNF